MILKISLQYKTILPNSQLRRELIKVEIEIEIAHQLFHVFLCRYELFPQTSYIRIAL